MDAHSPASQPIHDAPSAAAAESLVPLPTSSTTDVIAINESAKSSLAHWNAARQAAAAQEQQQVAAEQQKIVNEARIDRQYWWNFGILMGVVLLAWILWLRHLEHLLAQSLIIGLPVTVWTVLQLVRDWAPSGPLSEKNQALSQRILRHPRALEGLVLALVILILANGCTSSIYLTHSGSSSPPVEIKLTTGQQPFGDNLRASAAQPVQGRPEFFQFRRAWSPVELNLEAIAPHGYQLTPAAKKQWLYPWSRIRVNYPADFERIDYYVIRILPGKGLQGLRPKVDGKETPYTLIVEMNGKQEAQTNMTFDCFYFGADPGAVEEVRKEEPAANRVNKLSAHLTALGHSGQELQNRSESLAGSFQVLKTPPLHPGTKIRVTVKGMTSSGTAELEFKGQPNAIENLVIGLKQP